MKALSQNLSFGPAKPATHPLK